MLLFELQCRVLSTNTYVPGFVINTEHNVNLQILLGGFNLLGT
jgi:hypothetical protein